MPPLTIALAGAAAYAGAAVLVARELAGEARGRGAAPWLAVLALGAHLVFQLQNARAAGGVDVHFFAALSAVSLAMAVLTLALTGRQRMPALGAVVYPIAACLLVLDAALGTPTPTAAAQGWPITAHVSFALLSFAVLAIATLVALMLIAQERALRTRHLGGLAQFLPPLATTETLLFQLIGAGFGLLTLTLVTGAVFVEDLWAQHLVHKTVLSIAAWIVFGSLLVGRWRHGWRGRRAARLVLWGMLVLLLGFLGSKFVLELVLKRAP